MRRLFLVTLALLAMGAVFGMGHAMATAALTSPTRTVGTYDTPYGTLTVQGDGTGRFEPVTHHIPGACYRDAWHDGENRPAPEFYACVPLRSPDGSVVTDVWEDNSGSYGDSALYFDPETSGWSLRSDFPTPVAMVPTR